MELNEFNRVITPETASIHFKSVYFTECMSSSWGVNCNSSCGNCLDGAPCNRMTGHCPDGCEAGYKDPPFCTGGNVHMYMYFDIELFLDFQFFGMI